MPRRITNKQLDMENEETNKIKRAEEGNADIDQSMVVRQLAGYIRKCFDDAKTGRRAAEQQILKNLRQKNSQYEPEKLDDIKKMGGSEVFVGITGKKCWDWKAWTRDILFQPGQTPFDIETTPVPELPQSEIDAITNEIKTNAVNYVVSQVTNQGTVPDINAVQSQLKDTLSNIKEKVQQQSIIEGKKRVERVKKLVDDALVEGGWYEALGDCLDDIGVKIGFLKGPIYRNEKRQEIVTDEITGEVNVETKTETIATYERCNPLDIYPAPDSVDIDDGDLIHRITMNSYDLVALRDVPGYNKDAINRILKQHHDGGLREWTEIDSDRMDAQMQDSANQYMTNKIDALDYWGYVKGSALLDWGMSKDIITDELMEYPIEAYLIKDEVIMAQLNPRTDGKKPFSKCPFESNKDNFWGGRGLPEMIADLQQLCNAAARAIGNNMALGSGPQIVVNRELLEPGASVEWQPFKVWLLSEAQMGSEKVVDFYAPPMVAENLMRIFEFFSKKADEHSGIPAYAHGDPNVGGAGNTASGLSMLWTGAARGVKEVAKNIDEGIIETSVERQYYETIVDQKDPDLIGDDTIVAKGAASMVAKEQQSVRRTEFMNMVAQNQVYTQIVGIEGLRFMLREAGKPLFADIDKIVPEKPMPIQSPMPPQMGGETPGQNAPMPNAATLLPGGMPAGGAENREFTNYSGR